MSARSVTLVTGAGGFIGRHVCKTLTELGEPFVSLYAPGERNRLAALGRIPDEDFRELDLRDYAGIRKLVAGLTPGVVINLAAVGTYPNDPTEPMEFLDVNVRAPAALWQEMPSDSVFVQVGSMFQYSSANRPLAEETSERVFSTLYSWSKNSAEALLVELSKRRSGKPMPSTIRVRIFGVTGRGERPRRLVPSIVEGCRSGTGVDLSDGGQIRDVLHVSDVAAALIRVSKSANLFGMAVNIGRGEGRSVRWIAERAAARLSCAGQLRFGALERRPNEAEQLVADVSRLRTTGWQPRWTFEESIDVAVDELVQAETGER